MSEPLLPGVVEIIAGTPPGGGQDRAARPLAAAIGEGVEVRNVPGRGGGQRVGRARQPFLDSERVELAVLLESIGLMRSIQDG